MTKASHGSRAPRLSWLVCAALGLVIGAGGLFWQLEKRRAAGPPGLYAIPLDANSRAGGAWWTEPLGAPRTFAVGQTLKIPEGSRVRVVNADGSSYDLTGPARTSVNATAQRGETNENFLAVPLPELANLFPQTTNGVAGDVRIVSPVGVTRFTNPVLSWMARPETDYDVGIIDPLDGMAPPRVAEKVRPPVTMEQLESPQKPRLKPDRLYEVRIRETESTLMIGVARVLVEKDAAEGELPEEPADLLREAVDAMTKRPTRTGDAWLALSRLPAAWRDSELGVRLRLRIAGELGLVAEFALAQEAAWQLVKK